MQFLDRTGVGTLWSMCKTKFALKDHSHNYLPLSGGTLTGDLLFSNSGTTFRQIRGTCGDNDFWRIGGGATGSNAGYMEIATADDGTEPIYVRQYSGTFSTITRTATLLDGDGNTSFPGTVAAAKFKGALEGNASSATKSEYSRSLLGRSTSGSDYDASSGNLVFAEWNTMNDSRWYLKATGYECRVAFANRAENADTVNGHTVNANVPSNAKFTDTNTWRGIQDNLTSSSTSDSLSANQGRILKNLVDGKANSSHTHNWSLISGVPTATTTLSGIMSSTDKAKLDGIASGANNYTLPTASANTLGGIKVSGNSDGSSWPICVDGNGLAETKIQGLVKTNGILSNVILGDGIRNMYYNYNAIKIEDKASKNRVDIGFPPKSGTIALTSDLSDLCRFNFVNSISECKSDRINFLLGFTGYDIDLSDFDDYPDGTILIMNSINLVSIRHQSGKWYSDGDNMDWMDKSYLYTGKINLVTKNNGMVHHCRF